MPRRISAVTCVRACIHNLQRPRATPLGFRPINDFAATRHGIPKELQLRNPAMFKTKNDISEDVRTKANDLLNARLADAIDLATQIKQAHWNVKGPNFIALHELFDKINEDVEDYVDDIAERAVQLGGVAEGTARLAAHRSRLG